MRATNGQQAADSQGHRAPFQEIEVRADVCTEAVSWQLASAEPAAGGELREIARKHRECAVEINNKRTDAGRRFLSVRAGIEEQAEDHRHRGESKLSHVSGGIVAFSPLKGYGVDAPIIMVMTSTLHDMFFLGLPVAEKILRPVIVYIFLIAGLRLAGKRELAQLNPFDLVVLLTLSNTVQNAIIGNDNSVTGGLLGAATLLLVNQVVVGFLYRHERLDRLVEGDPDVLIENGVVKGDRLKRELITVGELESAAHKQGFASLGDIEQAMLEPGGGICFVAKKPTPDTARHEELVARLDRISAQLTALRA